MVPRETNFLLPEHAVDLINEDPLEIFDYCFEGVVLKVEYVSQFNGFGTNIPYTFYRVRVTREIKGEVDNEVIIKFYGGYDETGELVLLEDGSLPEIGEIYTFYCNRTNLTFEQDGRTLDGSYVINNPYCLVKGSVEFVAPEPEKDETWALTKPLTAQSYFLRDGLLVSTLGLSDKLQNARTISIGYIYTFMLKNGEPRYFKIKRNTLDYLAIYSTGSFDVKVIVYDDYYTYVTSNDDVPYDSRGRQYTSGLNFYAHFYGDKERYYYFEVAPYSSTGTGSTSIRVIVDNFHDSEYSLLLSDKNAVKSGKITYKDNSDYHYYVINGAAEWNKLNTIQITPKSSGADVTIDNYYDNDGIVAYTKKHWLWGWEIWYNDYYFSTMTYSQKVKSIMHEFGHTLGFGEFCSVSYCEADDNVMVQGIIDLYRLGPADIAVYRKRWG